MITPAESSEVRIISSRNIVLYVFKPKLDFEYEILPPKPFNSCVILKSSPEVGLTTEFVLSILYYNITALLFLFPTSAVINGDIVLDVEVSLVSSASKR